MWWTAEQAAAHLGVKRKTLYTYVSRGWIRSRGEGGRARKYLAEDVQELATRAAEARGRAAAAGAAMRWGPPVLATELSAVDPDGPYYRGRSALGFSEAHTPLEQIAAHLWGRPFRGLPQLPSPPTEGALTERVAVALLRRPPPDEEHALATVLAVVVGGEAEEARRRASVAQRLSTAFGPRPFDAVLALCVDHELNASTFAARVAAGTGADLGACLRAALATFSGPRHGGATETLEDALDAGEPPGPAAFGHPLYPHGDPRAERLFELAGGRPGWAVCGPAPPNLDAGLVALRRAWGLPRGSATALFLLGRVVGWCAHVAEQRTQPMIRPRAHYVGPPPR